MTIILMLHITFEKWGTIKVPKKRHYLTFSS